MAMKTILQSYNELLRTPSKWRYYSNATIDPCHFEDFVIVENNTLREMLEAGGKLSSVINDVIALLDNERYSHILSTYVMGLCIYNESAFIQECLDTFFAELNLNADAKYRKFMYIWLMMCSFHDVGYAIEEGQYDIDESLYKDPPELEGSLLIDAKLPAGFKNDLFDRYEVYRKDCMNKKDHGIWSGRILYTEVECLRKRRFQNVQNCLQNESCLCDGLCCREELRHIYSMVARTIMAHNIYYADKSSKKCYQCKNLEELIPKKKHNINIEEHPLLFFFDLIDTMEPIKRPELASLLDNISWRINNKSIVFDLSRLTCPQRILYTRQLTGMNSWLTSVEVDKYNCNLVRVKF